jgi:CRP-like cAMP-binding protein
MSTNVGETKKHEGPDETIIQSKVSYQRNVERIKAFMSKIPEMRTTKECRVIASMLHHIKFLEQYKNSDELVDMTRYLRVETYKPKSVVFRQGDLGDKFYIILDGSVTIYIDRPSEISQFTQMKEVAQLEAGDAFGELALIYDTARTATIITNCDTDLIVLSREVFQRYIKVTIKVPHS